MILPVTIWRYDRTDGATMTLDKNWFTEVYDAAGSAFSLRITARLQEVQSEYQKIEIYATEAFGNLMVIDGCVMLTTRDNFLYHEMLTHPALFTHSGAKRVLIIGGGDCGTLQEVLKHDSVTEAWQVDIDEQVTRMAEIYFPELCTANDDPRARLHFDDGIQWVKDAEDGYYDLIIVDSTDPVGPAEGLFSEPFFRDCHRALATGGILVQQSESPLFHRKIIEDMHRAMKGAGFASSLTLNFPQCVYPSGWWSATMTSKDGKLDGFRRTDCSGRNFSTRYYNEDIHQAAVAQPQFMREWALD
jgi:spermidine synthase